jgi:hypothetical protein
MEQTEPKKRGRPKGSKANGKVRRSVEDELEHLIESRINPNDKRDQGWRAPVEEHNEQEREKARWAWIRHEQKMAGLHAELSGQHARNAASLMREIEH